MAELAGLCEWEMMRETIADPGFVAEEVIRPAEWQEVECEAQVVRNGKVVYQCNARATLYKTGSIGRIGICAKLDCL